MVESPVHVQHVQRARRKPVAPPLAQTARRLAQAVERAISLEQWEHAERIARTAVRLAGDHPRLTESLARLRLGQGDPEAAIELIDTCRALPSSLRLLRAVCLVQAGRKVEAHLDLHEWSSRSAAPLQARVMLALLEWELGEIDGAIAALTRNLRHLEDPCTLAMLAVICRAHGRPDQHGHWAARLSRCAARYGMPHASAVPSAGDNEFTLLLHMLGLAPAHEAPTSDESQIQSLALELAAHEHVIPSLVQSQECRVQVEAARLLRTGIERALPDLADSRAAYEALARLSLALDERETARRWAKRGLEIHPLSASLNRCLKQCGRDARTSRKLRNRMVLTAAGRSAGRAGTRRHREKAA